MPASQRIVIIGGGPAGYEAAIAGAKYGASVTLIEDQGMGGSAVIHDCVPSKSFIAGASIRTDLRRADAMGLGDGVTQATVHLGALNARVQALAGEQSDDIAEQMTNVGVRVINGRGCIEDGGAHQTIHQVRATAADGSSELIECDLVLIATGAPPRVLPAARAAGRRGAAPPRLDQEAPRAGGGYASGLSGGGWGRAPGSTDHCSGAG